MYAGRIVESADAARAVRPPAPSLHRRPAGLGAAPRPAARRAAAPDRGLAARHHPVVARLRVRPALRQPGRRRAPADAARAGAGRPGRAPAALLQPGRRVRAVSRSAARVSLLEVRGLKVHFPITAGVLLERKVGAVRAVDGVDLDVERGETLGPGRRVGLRQEHPRQGDPAPRRADRGHRHLRRRATSPALERGARCASCAGACR